MPAPSASSAESSASLAVVAADALGSALGTFGTYDDATEPPQAGGDARMDVRTNAEVGSCKNYFEFFVPDRKGDANSTEGITFYDAACTQVARDAVRIYTSTGPKSESVLRTVSFYAQGNSTPIAVKTATTVFENAMFGKNGFAIGADGFDSSGSSKLAISGANTVSLGHELVMLPVSGNTSNFCGDSAGFDAYGVPPTNQVFGWEGGSLAGGTRTKNANGSITWVATRTGTAAEGKPSAFTLHAGTENTACPIATPMWTINGGSPAGSYSIPTTATYTHGILSSLTIANASLPGGTTLDVETSPSASFTSSTFITGTISAASGAIASFGVDAFGNGTLTLASGGKQFLIEDWQVVK